MSTPTDVSNSGIDRLLKSLGVNDMPPHLGPPWSRVLKEQGMTEKNIGLVMEVAVRMVIWYEFEPASAALYSRIVLDRDPRGQYIHSEIVEIFTVACMVDVVEMSQKFFLEEVGKIPTSLFLACVLDDLQECIQRAIEPPY